MSIILCLFVCLAVNDYNATCLPDFIVRFIYLNVRSFVSTAVMFVIRVINTYVFNINIVMYEYKITIEDYTGCLTLKTSATI